MPPARPTPVAPMIDECRTAPPTHMPSLLLRSVHPKPRTARSSIPPPRRRRTRDARTNARTLGYTCTHTSIAHAGMCTHACAPHRARLEDMHAAPSRMPACVSMLAAPRRTRHHACIHNACSALTHARWCHQVLRVTEGKSCALAVVGNKLDLDSEQERKVGVAIMSHHQAS